MNEKMIEIHQLFNFQVELKIAILTDLNKDFPYKNERILRFMG